MKSSLFHRHQKKQQRSRVRPAQQNTSSRESHPAARQTRESPRSRNPVSSGQDARSRQTQPARKPRSWRQLPLYALTLLIIGLLIYNSLIDASAVHIRMAHPSGSSQTLPEYVEADVARTEEYAAAATSALRDSIRNRSKFTVNRGQIEQQLLEQFPELQVVALELHFFDRTPVIRAVPRMPVLLVNSAEENADYYVDARGVVVAEASGEVADIPVITDEVGLELIPGSRVLPLETITFIENMRLQLESADLSISSMRLPAIANELHIEVAGDGFVGKFDITGDVRLQAGTFIAVRERVIEQDAQPNEYIDARVQGRAYYR